MCMVFTDADLKKTKRYYFVMKKVICTSTYLFMSLFAVCAVSVKP